MPRVVLMESRRSAGREFTRPVSLGNRFAPDGWYTRGYLPHFDAKDVVQHVTLHLSDSLPQAVLAKMQCVEGVDDASERYAEVRKQVDAYLDSGYGSCLLGIPEIPDQAVSALRYFEGQRYELFAWVIMPNHLHALFQPKSEHDLDSIVTSWKRYLGRAMRMYLTSRKLYVMQQGFWHKEFWDRFIRSDRHFDAVVNYIHANPVKAGLLTNAEDWKWSSAFKC